MKKQAFDIKGRKSLDKALRTLLDPFPSGKTRVYHGFGKEMSQIAGKCDVCNRPIRLPSEPATSEQCTCPTPRRR